MLDGILFTKMDGIGNDFVVIDHRNQELNLSTQDIIAIASRDNSVTKGCDQLILIDDSKSDADCFMSIYNADGGEVDACGNATRCIAYLMAKEKNKPAIVIETNAGILETICNDDGSISANMGKAKLQWNEIPLAEEIDTLHLKIAEGELSDPVAVSMGNPHAVFFVDDCDVVNLENIGPKLENHPLFPQRANIGVAQIISDNMIRLRVFERGAGETLACGTGACAALVAAHRRELTGRSATVKLKGGDLKIEWLENEDVIMTGPANLQFEGEL